MSSYSYTVEQYERLEDECRKQRARADNAEATINDLTHSGNGEVLKNWSKAYNRAMDQLEAAEEKLRLEQVENHALKKKCESHLEEMVESKSDNFELKIEVEQAYRDGYNDGSTAVNTVGPDALDHVEMHLKRWQDEK